MHSSWFRPLSHLHPLSLYPGRFLNLIFLKIHFDTTKIGHGLNREPQYQATRPLLRRPLHYLAIANASISLRDVGFLWGIPWAVGLPQASQEMD